MPANKDGEPAVDKTAPCHCLFRERRGLRTWLGKGLITEAMEVLLKGSAIRSFINSTSLSGYQVSGQDGDYRLHLETPEGNLTLQPIETLSHPERQALETLLSEKLSQARGR